MYIYNFFLYNVSNSNCNVIVLPIPISALPANFLDD